MEVSFKYHRDTQRVVNLDSYQGEKKWNKTGQQDDDGGDANGLLTHPRAPAGRLLDVLAIRLKDHMRVRAERVRAERSSYISAVAQQ